MWPAILVPFHMRPGDAEAPMEKGARLPVRLTVIYRTAGETVAFDHAGVSLAFRYSGDIDQVPNRELADIEGIANSNDRGVVDSEFPLVPEAAHVLHLAFLGRLETLRIAVPELHRTVAFFIDGLDLQYRARPGFDSSYCFSFTLFRKYLGHAQLLS
jgi:hypothetical protein